MAVRDAFTTTHPFPHEEFSSFGWVGGESPWSRWRIPGGVGVGGGSSGDSCPGRCARRGEYSRPTARKSQAMDGDDTGASVSDLADRDPGEDEDVYADVDLDSLPRWWREAVEEHEAFGLRPYRPPRFSDGGIVPPVVDRLADDHDASVRIVGRNVSHGDDWSVLVDGRHAFDVGRHRDPRGYTVYELSEAEFVARVTECLGAGADPDD